MQCSPASAPDVTHGGYGWRGYGYPEVLPQHATRTLESSPPLKAQRIFWARSATASAKFVRNAAFSQVCGVDVFRPHGGLQFEFFRTLFDDAKALAGGASITHQYKFA